MFDSTLYGIPDLQFEGCRPSIWFDNPSVVTKMMQEDAEADIQADVSNTLILNTLTFGDP